MQVGGLSGSRLSAAEAQLLEARAKSAVMIRASIIGAVVCMLVALGVLASSGEFSPSAADRDALALVCALLGLAALAGGYLVSRFVPVVRPSAPHLPLPTNPPSVAQLLAALMSRSIMQAAFFEVPSLLGFVLALMSARPLLYLPFFAVSLAALATTFPKRAAWEQEIVETRSPGIPRDFA